MERASDQKQCGTPNAKALQSAAEDLELYLLQSGPFIAGAELTEAAPVSSFTPCPLFPKLLQHHHQPGYLTRDCIATQFWLYCLHQSM